MPVKAYRNIKASTKENKIFDLFLNKLKEVWEESSELVILLGNFTYNNTELDAMLVKRDGIFIIDFKDYSGKLKFSENGQWVISTNDGKAVEVKGGSGGKNPFMQIRWYKDVFSKFFIINNKNIFLNSPKNINYQDIYGLVLFHETTKLKDSLPPRIKDWFFIADIHNVCQTINQITNRGLNLTNEELLKIPTLLDLEEYKIAEIKRESPPIVFVQELYEALQALKESLEIANIVSSNFEKYKARHEAFISFFYSERPEIITKNVLKELSFPDKVHQMLRLIEYDLENKIVAVLNCNSNANNILKDTTEKNITKQNIKNLEAVQKHIDSLKIVQIDLYENVSNQTINTLAFKSLNLLLYERGLWSLSAFQPIGRQISKRASVYPLLNALFEILRTWFAEDMIQHWDSEPRREHKRAAGFSFEWFDNLSKAFGEQNLEYSMLPKTNESQQNQIICEVYLPDKLTQLFQQIAAEIKAILSNDEYCSLLDLLKLEWIERDRLELKDVYLIELRTNTIFNLEDDIEFLAKPFVYHPNEYFYEPTYISVLEAIGNWGYGIISQEHILKRSYKSSQKYKEEVDKVVELWKSPKPSYFASDGKGERPYTLTNDLAIGDAGYNRVDISKELRVDPPKLLQFLKNFKDEWSRYGVFKEFNVGDRNFMLLLKQFKNENRIENGQDFSGIEITKTKTVVRDGNPVNTSALIELEKLVGLKSVKKEIESLLNFVKIRKLKLERGMEVIPSSLHMVFTGNPGTGKTIVARLIGKIYHDLGLLAKGQCIEVTRTDLVGEYIGHTAQHTTKKFKEAIGGVLFIDEAYSLVQGSEKDFGKEAVDTLNKLIEDYREEIVVIVAGYPAEMEKFIKYNKGLESRFPTKISFEDYTIPEKMQILEKFCSDKKHKLSVGAREKAYLLMEENKFENNARSVRSLFELMIINQSVRLNRIVGISDDALVTFEPEDVPSTFTN